METQPTLPLSLIMNRIGCFLDRKTWNNLRLCSRDMNEESKLARDFVWPSSVKILDSRVSALWVSPGDHGYTMRALLGIERDGQPVGQALEVWNKLSGRQRDRVVMTEPCLSCTFSPDGKYLACAYALFESIMIRIHVLGDVSSGEPAIIEHRETHIHERDESVAIYSIGFTPDSRKVLCLDDTQDGSTNQALLILDLSTMNDPGAVLQYSVHVMSRTKCQVLPFTTRDGSASGIYHALLYDNLYRHEWDRANISVLEIADRRVLQEHHSDADEGMFVWLRHLRQLPTHPLLFAGLMHTFDPSTEKHKLWLYLYRLSNNELYMCSRNLVNVGHPRAVERAGSNVDNTRIAWFPDGKSLALYLPSDPTLPVGPFQYHPGEVVLYDKSVAFSAHPAFVTPSPSSTKAQLIAKVNQQLRNTTVLPQLSRPCFLYIFPDGKSIAIATKTNHLQIVSL